ncbi:immunoglobulin-like domain-containing protein [Aquimarina sp. 433]
MQKKYLLIILLFLVGITTTNAQYTSIPDANFEAALVALGYDSVSGDGQVLTANIENVTTLDLDSKSISDLTGIEDFINLETLDVRDNTLTVLDLSSNIKLLSLIALRNQLTSLVISGLTELTYISAGYNNLTALDVSTNIALEELYISYNDIVNLNISDLTRLEVINLTRVNELETLTLKNNIALRSIGASRCNLSSLDLVECPNLETVALSVNNFTSLDFSNNPLLTTAYLSENELTSIDFRLNPLLTTLNMSENQLTSVDLRTGNTQAFTSILLEDNPNLTCVSIDDPVYASMLLAERLDAQTVYSKECGTYTYIPDENFEAALVDLGIDSTPNDYHVLNTSAEAVTDLNVANRGITDLTGIKAFTGVTTLNINENQIQEIDLSANLLLQDLDVSENLLQLLDLSMLPNLTSVNIQENLLFDFNLQNGNNTNITSFTATDNDDLACILVDDETFATTNFTSIDPQTSFSSTTCGTVYTAIPDANFENELSAYDDVPNDGQVPRLAVYNVLSFDFASSNIADMTGIEDFYNIERIDLRRNNISSIDLSNNPKLRELEIDDNVLTTLDLTNNPALQELILNDNDLQTLDLTQNTLLKILDLEDNFNLNSIDLTNNVLLEYLILSDTNLSTIDLSKNVALKDLEFDDPKIAHIDLSHNILLEDIEFDGAPELESVDLTGLTKLDYFYIEESKLSSIDFSTNIALTELEFYDTAVTRIDFSNNVSLEDIYISDNTLLTEVIFSNQTYPNLDYISAENTQLESIDVSNLLVLNELNISNTKVKRLDLSSNPAMDELYASNAQLEFLNVQNGNNSNFTDFEIDGNPNLFCVQVDDVDYANANFTVKDVQTTFGLDCTPPVITLLGDNPQFVEWKSSYTELGAITDDGSTIVIDASLVDVNQLGSYQVTYNATDAAGNMAEEVVRTVEVVDTTAPVITLNGANPQTIELGAGYTELGATTDDGSVVSINTSEFMDAVGSYTIYYDATDAAGNAAIQVTRTVDVVDTTAPIITLNGANPQTIELGAGYTELGATTDDGSVVSIDTSEFMDAVGSYTIYYDATDAAGNAAIQVTRTVDVVDTTNPTVVCQNITVQLDDTGNASITPAMIDNGSADLSGIASIVIDITDFDCTNIGDNMVTLTVTDANGNTDMCMATVTVEDEVAPEFDMTTVPTDMEVPFDTGNTYTLPDFTNGVVVTDNCDTNKSAFATTITQSPVAGTLLAEGDHVITLTATDDNSNIETVSFTITVSGVLSVEENTEDIFSIYPNPATDQFWITGVSGEAEVTFYDINGRMLQTIKVMNEQAVSTTDLSAGVYLITIEQNDIYQSIRLIKN